MKKRRSQREKDALPKKAKKATKEVEMDQESPAATSSGKSKIKIRGRGNLPAAAAI